MSENINNINEDDGVSLGEIFSWVWKKKIIGLITFAVVAIICFIVILLVSNSSKTYTVNFDYGKVETLTNNKYLDGSSFSYLDIVDLANLENIKNSNDEYNNIDINKLLDSINITKNDTYSTNSSNLLLDSYYTITVKQNGFKDSNIARKFLSDLVSLPINYNLNYLENLNYTNNFNLIAESKTYEDEVNYLTNQVKLITSGYESLITTFGDLSLNIDSSTITLSQLVENLESLLKQNNFDLLNDIIAANNYVKVGNNNDVSYYLDLYNSRLTALETRNNTLEAQVTSLNEQIADFSNAIIGDSTALQTLIEKRGAYKAELVNNEIEIEKINNVLTYITSEQAKGENGFVNDKAFGNSLKNLEEQIKNATNTYTNVYKTLYGRELNINYRQPNIIVSDGGISIIINAGISVVLGLIVGAILAGILGYNTTKKEKENKTIESEVKA